MNSFSGLMLCYLINYPLIITSGIPDNFYTGSEKHIIDQEFYDPLNWTITGYYDPVPLIQTQFGPIQGRQDHDPANKMDSEFYGGIPYAKPPVGRKKFDRPEKWTSKYQGVLDATNYKAPCLQNPYYPIWPSFEMRELFNQSRVPTTLDCLHLNIWRPAFPSRGINQNIHYFSTLVILYDEDFYWNRPEDPLNSGTGQSWSNDLLVVTMSYRTGTLGYFNGSNVALYDIKMGLEWIYENIHSFRGNRSKITVLGAGTASTLATLLAMNQRHWPEKLFSRLVLMNGKGLFTPGSFQSQQEITYYSNVSAKHFGCLDEGDGKPESQRINMTCMVTLTEEAILGNAAGQWPTVPGWWWYFNRFPWTPVIDGDIVREEVNFLLEFNSYNEFQLRQMFSKFRVDGINVLVGVPSQAGVQGLAFLGIVDMENASYQTSFDYKRYTARLNSDLGQCGMSTIVFQYNDWSDPVNPDQARRDSLIEMATDRFHRCPMVNFVNFLLKQAKYGRQPTKEEGRVWVYQWDHPYGKNFPEWFGAIDSSDFVYMMTHPMNTRKNPSFTADEARLSLAFSSYIGNFAWYGDPNYVRNDYWDGRDEKYTPNWPEATLNNRKKFMNFRVNNYTVMEDLASTNCAFWQRLVPTLHAEFKEVIEKSGIVNLPTMGAFYMGHDFAGPPDEPFVRCKREFAYQ